MPAYPRAPFAANVVSEAASRNRLIVLQFLAPSLAPLLCLIAQWLIYRCSGHGHATTSLAHRFMPIYSFSFMLMSFIGIMHIQPDTTGGIRDTATNWLIDFMAYLLAVSLFKHPLIQWTSDALLSPRFTFSIHDL